MNRILVDKFKKFMADVCTLFECGEMYQPLEQGFQCLCEAFYDFDDRGDYDPPDPWDNAQSESVCLRFGSGKPDGTLFDFDDSQAYPYIDMNVNAWFKLAGVLDQVPEGLDEAIIDDDGLEEVATQEIKTWTSPSQYFEDPGDGGSMYRINIDISTDDLMEGLKATLDACDCPDVLEAKLLAVVPQLADELYKLNGYTNDDNW